MENKPSDKTLFAMDLTAKMTVEQLAQEKEVELKILSMISDDELIRLYNKAKLVVYSPYLEPFGYVPLEAMACGLPIVSFDCPWGPRSIISDGEDGVLIADGDIPKLAMAIMQMIEDDQLRRKMACTARHNKTQFRIEYIADTWKILFEEVSSHRNNS